MPFSSWYHFKLEQMQKLRRTTSARYYSFRARNWGLIIDPENLTISLSIKLHISVLVLIPCHPNEVSPVSPFYHATWQHLTKEPSTCAWICTDIRRQVCAICSKYSKIVPYHRFAGIPRLIMPMKWNFCSLFYSRKSKTLLHLFIIFEFKLGSGAKNNFYIPPKLTKKNAIAVSEAWN